MAIEDNERSEVDRKINIRLYNYPESMIALKNLRAAYIGNVPYRFSCCVLSIQPGQHSLLDQKGETDFLSFHGRQACVFAGYCSKS